MSCPRGGIQGIERPWHAAHRDGEEISIDGGVQFGAQNQPRARYCKHYDHKPKNQAGPRVKP